MAYSSYMGSATGAAKLEKIMKYTLSEEQKAITAQILADQHEIIETKDGFESKGQIFLTVDNSTSTAYARVSIDTYWVGEPIQADNATVWAAEKIVAARVKALNYPE